MCRFVLDAKHLRTGNVLATVALRLVLSGNSWLSECGLDLLNISITQFYLSNLEVTVQSTWVCFMHKMFASFTIPLLQYPNSYRSKMVQYICWHSNITFTHFINRWLQLENTQSDFWIDHCISEYTILTHFKIRPYSLHLCLMKTMV